jgi:hypothetical protein
MPPSGIGQDPVPANARVILERVGSASLPTVVDGFPPAVWSKGSQSVVVSHRKFFRRRQD